MIFFKNIKSIGWRAFRQLLAFYLLSIMLTGVFIHLYLRKERSTYSSKANSSISLTDDRVFSSRLIFFDKVLIYSFWILTFLVAGFGLIFIRRLLSPLEHLILKAQSIEKEDSFPKGSPFVKKNQGEWYQLDIILDKISLDLKKRRVEVQRERGELEAVISVANDAILVVDKNMNIRYYNASFSSFFDQKEEGSLNHNLKEVIRNESIIKAFQRALKEQIPQKIQTELDRASSVYFFEVSISLFFDEKKMRPRGAVALFHDITEHRRIGKVRMDFVANASHELKTPLTSVQGYLDHIKENCLDKPGLKRVFGVVENNLNRLGRLINDLLQLSKIETAGVIQKEEVRVQEVTEDILTQLQSSIQSKKHYIFASYDLKILKTNRDILEQIIINLIDNAIKYCPESAKIKLHWGYGDKTVFFSVKDNGPGIESYHQGRLFERFYRVRDSITHETEGTGLGLSIVRNSMEKLNGFVDVKSVPGLGSEFICHFSKKPQG